MPTYTAVIKRKKEEFAVVEIEADSSDEAERKAQEMAESADNLDFEESFGGSETAYVDSVEEACAADEKCVECGKGLGRVMPEDATREERTCDGCYHE